MGVELENIKKQVMAIHQAVLLLDLQYRLEAIDFLSDCCNDLRLKTLTYQDLGGDHVLNLTMSHKECIPFTNHLESEAHDDRFDEDFRMQPFCDQNAFHHHYDYGNIEYGNQPEFLDSNFETAAPEFWEPNDDTPNEIPHPVNLVMPGKKEENLIPSQVKKSRRKQMFTRKSVRLLNSKASSIAMDLKEEKVLSREERRRRRRSDQEKSVDLKVGEVVSGPMCCRQCRNQFINMREFKRHKEEKKCKPKSSLNCLDCGLKFKYETHFLKHMNGHRDYNCKHCSEKMSSKADFRKHMKKSHPDIKLDNDLIFCKFCPMSFPRLHRLYRHYQLHHSKGKFVCTICGLFIQTKEKHKEHMAQHENEKKYACDVCSRKFYSKHMLTNHIKAHNTGYRCISCGISLVSKQELMPHKRKGHEVVGLEPQFKCDHCDKMFLKKSCLEKHKFTHAERNNRDFWCSHCNKAFNTSYGLTKHERRSTHFQMANIAPPESKYEKIFQDSLVCEVCGKQFKTPEKFNAHVRTHKTTYNCGKCSTTLSIKDNMKRHIRKHDGKPEAVCELCGDSFSRIGGLKEHMMIKHSDDRPVACPSCPKRFKRKSELNRHMRIHESVRPYVCFCGKAYKQSAHLKSHQIAAHKGPAPPPASSHMLPMERADPGQHNSFLSLGTFEEQDYRIQEPFKVPYVPEEYVEPMGYEELPFGQTSVSPAVDLSMVSISDVAKSLHPNPKTEQEPATMPLVNLTERIVQEYLLNLP